MNKKSSVCVGILATVLILATSVYSVNPPENIGEMWHFDNGSWQEKEMNDAGVKGWYMPLGPTGIRAMPASNPRYWKVMYVFEGTPVYGKVRAGDVVAGANGTLLDQPCEFRGGDFYGPWKAMAPLIEDSQATDGKLELMILPGGKEPMQKVTVTIPVVGRFSPTFPFDCERSDKLISSLCDYLAAEHERNGGRFREQSFIAITAYLALMASGEDKYAPLIQSEVETYIHKKPVSPLRGNTWHHGYEGILLGEYYLRHKDKRLLPYMKSLTDFYADGIGHERPGYSHVPRPEIVRRVGTQLGGAGVGYGAMAGPAGLSMLAMSLFKAGDLPYDEFTYERLHQAYLDKATPERVNIVYGFQGNKQERSVHVMLKDPTRARSGRGVGFRVPTGMKEITDYEIIGHSLWSFPETSEVGWLQPWLKDTSWIEKERDTNIVVEWTGGRRHIIRAPTNPEPTKPYNTTGACAEMPVGLGALAHTIGNPEKQSWQYLGEHAGNSCALGYDRWFDGHACGSMHQLWVALGASRAEPEKFRKFMDGVKWWFIMQQSHDGSYMIAPNRDRPTANKDGQRGFGLHTHATANAALVLAIARQGLQITGAE